MQSSHFSIKRIPEQIMASSWADEIEEEDSTTLPAPSEKVFGDTKILTSYAFNADGKKVKYVKTFKLERKMASTAIAARRKWQKFGMSANDRPGPDPSTTVVTYEIMRFMTDKDESKNDNDNKLREGYYQSGRLMVFECRICKKDHRTSMCPYKDILGPLLQSLDMCSGQAKDDKSVHMVLPYSAYHGANGGQTGGATAGGKSISGNYVPPFKRDDTKVGDAMPDRRRTDVTAAIRVSNLSENTEETDLQELFKPFGQIARIYMSKHKITGQCKGFAFINYYKKVDASKAISTLNGYGYDNLILNVEWAKPSGS